MQFNINLTLILEILVIFISHPEIDTNNLVRYPNIILNFSAILKTIDMKLFQRKSCGLFADGCLSNGGQKNEMPEMSF